MKVLREAESIPSLSLRGVDNWVSSDLHKLSEEAETPQHLKEVYTAWAANYDKEMKENDLKSYYEVSKQALCFLERKRGLQKGQFRAVDVGCGTGFCGSFLKKSLSAHPHLDSFAQNLHLTGIDLVPAMLEEARKKNAFDELIQVNLKADVSYGEDGSFDLMVSSGCFYPGHLGPDVLPNILRKLKPDGAFVFTVRQQMFETEEEDFLRFISESNCVIASKQLTPYYGEILAYTIIVCRSDVVESVMKSKGFARVPMIANESDIEDLVNYMKKRMEDNHPGNVYDSRGHIRAVHGYEEGLISNLVNSLAVVAKRIVKSDRVYMYQFRMNNKQPSLNSGAGAWKPHRDYDFWHGMDGMKCPESVAIFHILVSENTVENGAVYLCDASNNEDIQPNTNCGKSWKDGFQEDLKYTLAQDRVKAWPMHTPMVGRVGDIFVMHSLTWHYSKQNNTDDSRILCTCVFNSCDNAPLPLKEKRPEFVVHPENKFVF